MPLVGLAYPYQYSGAGEPRDRSAGQTCTHDLRTLTSDYLWLVELAVRGSQGPLGLNVDSAKTRHLSTLPTWYYEVSHTFLTP